MFGLFTKTKMTIPLSQESQEVLDSYLQEGFPSALRSAAGQLAYGHGSWAGASAIIDEDKLLSIATELEGITNFSPGIFTTTMTNQPHPITPSPELRCQWQSESPFKVTSVEREDYMIDRAAQWAADQQLEVCLRYAGDNGLSLSRMREALRPKPPSAKQQALYALDEIDGYAIDQLKAYTIHDDLKAHVDTIRCALEQLPDDPTPQ
jgi:hypothetical protein